MTVLQSDKLPSVPAVDVHGLRKTFQHKQGSGLRARKNPSRH